MKIMIFRKNVLKQQDYLLHTETVGGNHCTFHQPIIHKLPLVILTYKSETIAFWCTVNGGLKGGEGGSTVNDGPKQLQEHIKTNGHSFVSKPLSMTPLISTAKHSRSDGILLSTCPEALVVPSIAAGMEVCCIIQVYNIHQRIVRALRLFGGSGAGEGQVSACERECAS